MKFLKKLLYYGTIIPPIISTIKVYLQATKELAEQLKILNERIDMEENFEKDNADDE